MSGVCDSLCICVRPLVMMLKLDVTYGAASATAISMSRQASSTNNFSRRCLWIVPACFMATQSFANTLYKASPLCSCSTRLLDPNVQIWSRSLDYSLSVFRHCQIWRSSCSNLVTACRCPEGGLQNSHTYPLKRKSSVVIMARGRGRGRGRGGGRGRGRGRPDGEGEGSDESGEEFEERPKMGTLLDHHIWKHGACGDRHCVAAETTHDEAAAAVGQSATAGLLPPSDSEDDEEAEKPAPKPKGQVSELLHKRISQLPQHSQNVI